MDYIYEYSEEYLQLSDKIPDCITVIAFYGSKEIGSVGCSKLVAKTLNIGIVTVQTRHQGKGVGTKMLTILEAKAKERGFENLSLEVHKDNIRAKRLYEKMNFQKADVPGPSTDVLETWTKCIL